MANNTPKNSQETKDQNQRTVSEKLQLAVAATLALMMADLSSPTKLQQQSADRWAEISQSMKELGSKAVDKMLVWLEKVVDAIGPTPAYAGWNPDEDLFGEMDKKNQKIVNRNNEVRKDIKKIHERNARLEIIKSQLPFLTDIVSWKVSSQDPKNKARWRESREKILKNLDELSPDLQIDYRNHIRDADKIMWI